MIHTGTVLSRRRLFLGLGAVAVVGAGATSCAAARQQWTHNLGGRLRGLAAGDGVVFAAGADDNRSAAAIDVRTGEARWTYEMTSAVNGPITVDDLVMVDDRYGVHALDAATGTRRWMDEEAWLVDAGDGIVLCGHETPDNGYTLTAVDAASGEARWIVPLGPSPGDPAAIAGSRVHIGSSEVLHTLDAATGATVWEQPLRHSTDPVGITVAGAVVCCAEDFRPGGTSSIRDLIEYGSISQVGFDAASGRQLWRRADEEWATAHASTLCISARSYEVVAWDAATGATRWTVYPLNDAPATIGAAPVVAGDSCLLAYYRLSTQRTTTDGAPDMQVVVLALAADTGESRWSAEIDLGAYPETPKQDPQLALTVVGDTVVVGHDRGTVVGIA
ncbi:PQQ-binding-like beta-propeller repeat protein [Pseudonocardia sp. DSM 110487]|uniref:outer membrane protein assembly factor BamB family protein n=1 Tax=Pseudonocardia sp. DSM 110487 TaxID=2865833 RepID=UPI001C696EF0|nr:PQQ-binding-like beta-propeller repeat protein [Pseudonocardia sp. DSM 110487]QYN38624.1 PQQ-binding-like beta-propeller repeat protein [Pseudonocardia sp. DSM 110487]